MRSLSILADIIFNFNLRKKICNMKNFITSKNYFSLTTL